MLVSHLLNGHSLTTNIAVVLAVPLTIYILAAVIDWFSTSPGSTRILRSNCGGFFLQTVSSIYGLAYLLLGGWNIWLGLLMGQAVLVSVILGLATTMTAEVRADRLLPIMWIFWVIVPVVAVAALANLG